ncbi:MAG: NAD-binding protein [Verrucomicrobiota bacterium]
MNRRVAVIGLGIFGNEVAVSLAQRGMAVLALDRDSTLVEAVKDQVDQALILDATLESALREAGLAEISTVVVAIGNQNLEGSILTTALCKQLGVPRIVARAVSRLHEQILRQVGATEVVNPEQEMAQRAARQIAVPGFRELFQMSEGVTIAEIPVPKAFAGKSVLELNIRQKYHVNVIAVRSPGAEAKKGSSPQQEAQVDLEPSKPLGKNDVLIVVGNEKAINTLSKRN